jgi:hypothetical protein
VFVFRHVINDNSAAAIANFVADCRPDVEFPAGQQPERNFVANGAGNPTVLRYPRYRGESHSGRAANHFQNGSDRIDLCLNSQALRSLQR